MNRRLALLLFAAATVAGPLAAGPDAMARDGRGGGRGGWEQRSDRGPQQYRGQGRDQGERRMGSGQERMRQWIGDGGPPRGRSPGRRDEGGRGNGRNYYGPPPGESAQPRSYGVRRGGYLPPEARGAEVQDYDRYRLRPPPRGFRWVRVGGGYALVGPDGQIFDMIR